MLKISILLAVIAVAAARPELNHVRFRVRRHPYSTSLGSSYKRLTKLFFPPLSYVAKNLKATHSPTQTIVTPTLAV